jgi:hypothetical protein
MYSTYKNISLVGISHSRALLLEDGVLNSVKINADYFFIQLILLFLSSFHMLINKQLDFLRLVNAAKEA